MRKRPTWGRPSLIVAVGMSLILVATSAPASAAPSAPVEGTSCTSSRVVSPSTNWQVERAALSATATEDMTQLAKQKGISVSQAIDGYGWRDALSAVVGKVQAAFPKEYGGAQIVDDGEARAWVAFAGAAPAAALEMLRASPVPVAVRTGCGFSEAELKQRLEQVHYAVLGRTDMVADAASGYDIETGAITVMVEPVPGPEPARAISARACSRTCRPETPASGST